MYLNRNARIIWFTAYADVFKFVGILKPCGSTT